MPGSLTQIEDLTDAQILESIEALSQPAYQNLSRIHTAYLAELHGEARLRRLTH